MPRTRAAVVPHPRRLLRRLVPSLRSLLVLLAIVALAGGAYGVARRSSVFAVRRIEVAGASPAVAAQVRAALAPLRGRSLVGLDRRDLARRVAALSTVVAVGYDRSFPHTLRLVVRPERPAAVLRRGADAWLVSVRGRVIRPLPPHALPALPRLWVTRGTEVAPGALLGAGAGAAARALGDLDRAGFPGGVRAATVGRDDELALTLGRGLTVRLGRPVDLALKLTVARRIVPAVTTAATYLDVSVPERPVSDDEAQVSG